MTAPTAQTASTLHTRDATLLRASLVTVWLATALASALEAQGQSVALLAQAGVRSPAAATAVLWAGIAFDVVVGLLLWRRPGRLAFDAALLATLAMTVITSALLPAMWLHPLGPLLKNLPIAAALVVLRRNTP